ncbi:MAG TPA: hypothetical protein VF490_18250 [Chryseosolibacter sp.]
MRRPSRSGLLLVFVLSASTPLAAQNLESIGKEKPFSLTGGLSFNQVFYSSAGISARRDPSTYFATGNVNLSIYGWAIPLSFSVSNHQASFTQPFNRYSLHPSWKWITAHAGYTSASFSPYTVNGHLFLGGAVDLEPQGRWKVSGLYGRLLKATPPDTTRASPLPPSFQRMGYGLKVSYGAGRDAIDLIFFHAADVANSLEHIPDSSGVTPQENLVVGVAGAKQLFRHLVVKAEVASSALTKDRNAEKATARNHPLASAGILFSPRTSSSYYQALKTSLDYQREGWVIGVAWERIDPGYRTLGAYYFNNDLENVTLNGSGGLLQGKISIAASGGFQHDNVGNTKISTMRRLVGSLNVNYTPDEKMNLSASYSSFQTFTNIRSRFETLDALTPYDNLDTLNFTQISRNASLSGMWTLKSTRDRRRSVSLNLTWQDAADRQGDVQQDPATRFYNVNSSYSLTLAPEKITLTLAFNGSINTGALLDTRTWGPNAAIVKAFAGGKFRITLASSCNRTWSQGRNMSTVVNGRLNGAVLIGKRHNLTFSTVCVKRVISEGAARSFSEFTGTVGYSWGFGNR